MLETNKWYYGIVQDNQTIGVYDEKGDAEKIIELLKPSHIEAEYKIIIFMLERG